MEPKAVYFVKGTITSNQSNSTVLSLELLSEEDATKKADLLSRIDSLSRTIPEIESPEESLSQEQIALMDLHEEYKRINGQEQRVVVFQGHYRQGQVLDVCGLPEGTVPLEDYIREHNGLGPHESEKRLRQAYKTQ